MRPYKAGIETSEFRLAQQHTLIGAVAAAVGAVFGLVALVAAFARAPLPAVAVAGALAVALVLGGALVVLGAFRHYAGARASVKSAAVAPTPTVRGGSL